MHTKDIGDIAEQFVIAHCLKCGWIVSKTVGDNQLYDLVLDKGDGKLLKVQVKNGKLDDGVILISPKSCGYMFDGKGNRILFQRKYSPEDVDFIASYCPDTNECYLIKNEGNPSISLRITPPKNNQTKKIRYAKDYEI
jgi:hypothetical protein